MDEEIFDDSDFYQQLLKDLVETSSSKSNDPLAMTRSWFEANKDKVKLHKDVDRKASKGRKIRSVFSLIIFTLELFLEIYYHSHTSFTLTSAGIRHTRSLSTLCPPCRERCHPWWMSCSRRCFKIEPPHSFM